MIRLNILLSFIVGLLLVHACGGDPQTNVLPESDATAAEACEMPEGLTYLTTKFQIAPAEIGFDLNGDGQIDNKIGNLPPSAISAMAKGWNDSILAGEYLIGMQIEGWDAPRTANDSELVIHWLTLNDADELASNNMSGGEFWVSDVFLDLSCNSKTATEAVLTESVLRASRPRLDFPLTTGTGSIELLDMEVELIFDDSLDRATARVGGNFTVCAFSGMPLPLSDQFAGSALDYFINDPENASRISIDVDVDGDGLEQVIGDGVAVVKCIDGNGTIIEGRDCPCHPKIADAYSIGFSLEFLRVPILGII